MAEKTFEEWVEEEIPYPLSKMILEGNTHVSDSIVIRAHNDGARSSSNQEVDDFLKYLTRVEPYMKEDWFLEANRLVLDDDYYAAAALLLDHGVTAAPCCEGTNDCQLHQAMQDLLTL